MSVYEPPDDEPADLLPVTGEMLQAGVEILVGFQRGDDDATAATLAVYQAMEMARRGVPLRLDYPADSAPAGPPTSDLTETSDIQG